MRPLPCGSIIEYLGQQAIVISDDGGEKITVNAEGERQEWFWEFEGESCKIISIAGE